MTSPRAKQQRHRLEAAAGGGLLAGLTARKAARFGLQTAAQAVVPRAIKFGLQHKPLRRYARRAEGLAKGLHAGRRVKAFALREKRTALKAATRRVRRPVNALRVFMTELAHNPKLFRAIL